MGGFTCCVPGCFNNSTKHKDLGFYVFPKENGLRQQWIRGVDRAGQSGRFSKFDPTAGHRVCGVHFEGGKKTYMVRIPTIFPLKKQKVTKRRPLTRMQEPTTSTADEADTACPDIVSCSSGDSELPRAEFEPLSDHSYSLQEVSEHELLRKTSHQRDMLTGLEEKLEQANAQVAALKRQLEKSRQERADAIKLCNRVQQKNRWLKLELSVMHKQMKSNEAEVKETEFMYETISQDQKKLKYYTGFTSQKRLDAFWSLLEADAKKLQFWQMGTARQLLGHEA
ncbi:unnamed protein product [Ixodes hexagonus]